jgi:hypothetical protein
VHDPKEEKKEKKRVQSAKRPKTAGKRQAKAVKEMPEDIVDQVEKMKPKEEDLTKIIPKARGLM